MTRSQLMPEQVEQLYSAVVGCTHRLGRHGRALCGSGAGKDRLTIQDSEVTCDICQELLAHGRFDRVEAGPGLSAAAKAGGPSAERDISGFAIMDGDQLGYSDSYTYFTRDYSEAESLLDEVKADNPSMRVVPAVLTVAAARDT